MKQRARSSAVTAVALFLVAVSSAAAQVQSPGARIDQAVQLLVEQGQWAQACQELDQVLQSKDLTPA